MVFKRIYEFLFFAFYCWSTTVNGKESYHVLYASLMLGFVLVLNIAAALIFLEISTGVKAMALLGRTSTIPMIIGSAIFVASHYLYFRLGDRYVRVLEEHGRTADRLSRPQVVAVACYVAGSFLLLVGMMIFVPPPA